MKTDSTGRPIVALASLWNGSLTGKRKQEILTPARVYVPLAYDWDGIACDVAADAARHVPALDHIVYPDRDGLRAAWPDRSYCNPPFADLKAWLAHAAEQTGRRALLCPIRTHRPWYRAAAATCSARFEFNALKFVGYKQPFPAPLELLCWGWVPKHALWKGAGDVRTT